MNATRLSRFKRPIGYLDGRPIYPIAGGAPTRLEQIDTRLAAIRDELTTLETTEATRTAEIEGKSGDDLTAIETARATDAERATALITEWDTLSAERIPLAERAEKMESIRSASLKPGNRTPGSSVDDTGETRDRSKTYDIDHLRTNPMLDQDSVRTELVSRAMDAIEDLPKRVPDEVREAATRTLELVDDPAGAAIHILTTGRPAYRTAFRQALRGVQPYMLDGEERDAMRAAMALASANGGYLLPFELDPTIILTNAGTSNAIRSLARVVQTTQNVWHGVTSAGVTAEWTAEAAEAADGSPTFAQPSVTCFKADAYLQASFEFLQDSNIESDVGMLIADAKDRLEAAAFTNGNGTTQPHGVIAAISGVTASRVAAMTNGAFGAVDVVALDNALSPRWRANATFLANKAIYNQARFFATGSGPLTGTFWVDFGGGLPPKMIGYDARQASDMPSSLSAATASNDDVLLLGDFKQYLIADRIGVSLVYEPLVKGPNQRPTGQVGWYATWRTGADVVVNDAFRLLRV
jgi:HK97 family phage major capsid protein